MTVHRILIASKVIQAQENSLVKLSAKQQFIRFTSEFKTAYQLLLKDVSASVLVTAFSRFVEHFSIDKGGMLLLIYSHCTGTFGKQRKPMLIENCS